MTSLLFVVTGAAATVGGIGVFGFWNLRARGRENLRLLATVLLATGVLALVAGWLLADPAADRGEAMKTGGLAAGSVVALYALWLNDRRRRVEEDRQALDRARQELDSARAEHDRERAADERFLRAVELLGADADQVRVGALHALAGLARARPAYTQDVLDVICSYLRRPFDHPRHALVRGAESDRSATEADQWLQVRLTAQRLIADLLPVVGTPDAPAYDLDLHGATLEYFDVSYRVIGQLRARRLNLYESNSFHHCVVRGPAWFTESHSWGRLYVQDTVFEQRSWFSRFTAHAPVDFARTAFHGDTKFAESTWEGPVSFRDAVFDHDVNLRDTHFGRGVDLRVSGDALTGDTHAMRVSRRHENHLPTGWQVDGSRDDGTGLVRA